MNKDKLPIIGKTYYCYDDGKVTHSRQYEVKIVDVIEFDKAPEKLRDLVKGIIEYNEYLYLYKDETDYIVIGVSYETHIPAVEIFIRTKSEAWFGIGEVSSDGKKINNWYCSGHLDVTGELTKSLE